MKAKAIPLINNHVILIAFAFLSLSIPSLPKILMTRAKIKYKLFQTFSKNNREPALLDTNKKGLDFLLISSAGKTINIAEQKGKVLFINFWAASCVPCMTEMPSIN